MSNPDAEYMGVQCNILSTFLCLIIIRKCWKKQHWWRCGEKKLLSVVTPFKELSESKICINNCIFSNVTSKNLPYKNVYTNVHTKHAKKQCKNMHKNILVIVCDSKKLWSIQGSTPKGCWLNRLWYSHTKGHYAAI